MRLARQCDHWLWSVVRLFPAYVRRRNHDGLLGCQAEDENKITFGSTAPFYFSIGHFACLFFLEVAFMAYDILGEITRLRTDMVSVCSDDSSCLVFSSRTVGVVLFVGS